MSPPSRERKRDWVAWHEPYEDPASALSRRLRIVQGLLRDALDAAPPGPVRAISICAGRARDLLEVVAEHPRAPDVSARLVELDVANAGHARRSAAACGLTGIEVVAGDAGLSTVYDGAVPADVVLACGVFGNVPDADVHQTIGFLPAMCALRATVIWTRHRKPPDLTAAIRTWFIDAGFEEIAFVAPMDAWFGVGAHRLVGPTQPFARDERLFTFFR